jgi:hypothetical protein
MGLYEVREGLSDGPFGPKTDCAMRQLMLKFAQQQVGFSSRHAFDALELAARCNATPPPQLQQSLVQEMDSRSMPLVLYVDYDAGDDTAKGGVDHPLRTVAKALAIRAAESTTPASIVLRKGVHFLPTTLQLTVQHSNTVVEAFCSSSGCEEVWISGGVAVPVTASGAGSWQPHNTSGHLNIWELNVPPAVTDTGASVQSALHWLDDLEFETALDRARWPNRKPSDGTIDKPSLLDVTATTAVWEQKQTVSRAVHKRVESPSVPLTTSTEFNHWMVGVGGECARFSPPVGAICNPNATGGGYNWDGPGPYFPTALQLGNATSLFPNSGKWAGSTDRSAAGSKSADSLYSDMSQAVLTAWTNGWFTSHFDIASFDHAANSTLHFGHRGGVQGGRGWHFDASLPKAGAIHRICTGNVRATDCGPVKIEGLLAELDAKNEYFISALSKKLYLFYNGTGAPPAERTLVVPTLQTLLSIKGSYSTGGGDPAAGPPTQPVSNITIRGIGFRDAAPTFLEKHGIPSGGDWSLQRTAAVSVSLDWPLQHSLYLLHHLYALAQPLCSCTTDLPGRHQRYPLPRLPLQVPWRNRLHAVRIQSGCLRHKF